MRRVNLILFQLAVVSTVLGATDVGDSVTIRGFGTWGFGVTDENSYQFGEPDGNYQNTEFTLMTSAQPHEQLRIVAQIFFEATNEAEEVKLDFGFAEWRFTDSFHLRFGRAKHPFGIYGEVLRVGTLRPFATLPQGLYGPDGMVADQYDGVGASGSTEIAGGWDFRYEIYGGELGIEITRPWLGLLGAGENLSALDGSSIGDVLGARIIFTAPTADLNFGLSAFRGTQQSGAGGRIPEGNHEVYGGHIEYLTDAWLVRAETARHNHLEALTLDAAYIESAYKLDQHWQVALRWDWAEVDIDGFGPIARAPSLWEHQDLALALNYWFTPDLVVRLEFHRVDGNRFANPDDIETVLADGRLETETDLVHVAALLSF